MMAKGKKIAACGSSYPLATRQEPVGVQMAWGVAAHLSVNLAGTALYPSRGLVKIPSSFSCS
jgi:hypothetical protein